MVKFYLCINCGLIADYEWDNCLSALSKYNVHGLELCVLEYKRRKPHIGKIPLIYDVCNNCLTSEDQESGYHSNIENDKIGYYCFKHKQLDVRCVDCDHRGLDQYISIKNK